MIDIFISNNKAFVWNAEDAYKLRSEHRIVGSLVGCFPRQKFQNTHKYLPLQLSLEEATLLSEKGIAQLVSNMELTQEPSEQLKEKYFAHRNKLCDEQLEKMKETRFSDIMDNAETIYKGQKRKDLGNFDENSPNKKKRKKSKNFENKIDNEEENDIVINDEMKKEIAEKEMAKLSNLSHDNCLIQLFTEFPYKKACDNVPADWTFPRNDEEKLRYLVFKDLWEKKYFLTSGLKFGGDFLVYAGDPVKFHAMYIVVCIEQNKDIRGDDLIVYGRLGNQVKKTVLLASVDIQNKIEYISLNWAPDVTEEIASEIIK